MDNKIITAAGVNINVDKHEDEKTKERRLMAYAFKMVRAESGMNRKEFAEWLGIPYRTMQHTFFAARIIYTLFVCVIVALLGGCWKTYDTESQRNMVMLICFGVTALLGIISWCGSIKKDEN